MPREPLDQIAAIRILDHASDREDPAWENACSAALGEPDCPEPSDGSAKDDARFDREDRRWQREMDKLPTFGDVLLALGVPLSALRKAFRGRGSVGKFTAFSKQWRMKGPDESPNASVVAEGVRGDPTVERSIRVTLGKLLDGARVQPDSRILVSMDDLESLCHAMLVDFEVHGHEGEKILIPLALYSDDECRELTEEEFAAKNP